MVIPWSGTSWGQHAQVQASAKTGGPKPHVTLGAIRLDEPEDGGFFHRVDYGEIDPRAPSQYAAGVITVNINDPLNQAIFGESKAEFDKRLSTRADAQQRLASLLLEEASFRALEHNYTENLVILQQGREVTNIHEKIDEYKFESAVQVFRALTRGM